MDGRTAGQPWALPWGLGVGDGPPEWVASSDILVDEQWMSRGSVGSR